MLRPLQFGYDRHVLVLSVSLLLTALSITAFPHLRIDLSSRTLYNPYSEEARIYESVLEDFGSDQLAIIVARDQKLFSTDKLVRLADLNERLEGKVFVQKVDSLFTLPDIRDRDGFIEFSPLLSELPKTDTEAVQTRQLAIENPLLFRNVISEDGTLTALTLYLDSEFYQSMGPKAIYAELQDIINDESKHFDSLYQLGKPAVHHWLLNALSFDQRVTLPAAGAILFLLLVITLRSASFGFVPILNALLASLWTAGFLVLFDIPLNLLNYIVPLLILVVGATEDVHIIHEFKKGYKETGEGHSAIKLVSCRITLALILTAATTMLGFAATSASELPILQQFGITAFVGIGFRFIIAILVLPALLRLLEKRTKKLSDGTLINENTVWSVSHSIVKHGAPQVRGIVLTVIATALVAAYFSSNITSSNAQSSFLSEDNQLRKLDDETADALTGSTVFYVRIKEYNEAFLHPEKLNQLKKITEYIAQVPGVDSSRSFADAVCRINHQLNEGDNAYNIIPVERNAVKQMLLFTRPGIFDAYVTPNFSRANIIVRTRLDDSDALNKLVGSIRAEFESGRFGPLNYDITGDSVLVAAAVTSIVQAQIYSLGGMALIVFCIISVLFISIRCGLIAVITNLFSMALVFGLMGYTGIPLNVGTCMVAAITLGIGIDDTIHLLTQFNRNLKQCKNETTAITEALRQEMNPIISTSLALAGGFAVLGLSSFEPVRQFGLLSSCVIVLALVSDLILIPIFFSKTRLVTLWDIIGMKIRRSLLEQSPFFRGLSPWHAKKLILSSRIESHLADDYVIKEGSMGSTMYVVIEGELEAILERPNQTVHLANFKFGDVFGEVGIVGESERSASVKTKTASKVLALDGEALEKLKRFSPYLASQVFLNISRILATRMVSGNENVRKLS